MRFEATRIDVSGQIEDRTMPLMECRNENDGYYDEGWTQHTLPNGEWNR